ncbi:MAG: hypothetical protein WC767_02200 [Candidatus Paceibacterota bacterium]|jgi:hypothetical protein
MKELKKNLEEFIDKAGRMPDALKILYKKTHQHVNFERDVEIAKCMLDIIEGATQLRLHRHLLAILLLIVDFVGLYFYGLTSFYSTDSPGSVSLIVEFVFVIFFVSVLSFYAEIQFGSMSHQLVLKWGRAIEGDSTPMIRKADKLCLALGLGSLGPGNLKCNLNESQEGFIQLAKGVLSPRGANLRRRLDESAPGTVSEEEISKFFELCTICEDFALVKKGSRDVYLPPSARLGTQTAS